MLVIAHGIVGRADLPIPEALFGAAAAAVLVVSFLALAAGWSRPRLEPVRERRAVPDPARGRDRCCGAIGVAVFAVVVYAGLAGTDSQQDNLAPTAVYVGFWVGVPFLSLLLGDWFRLFNPWRAIGRATGWVAGRLSRGEATEVVPVPRAARPLARRGGDPRVRDLRAVLGDRPRARRRSAVLMLIYVVRAARRPGRLRRRGVVAPRRRVRRLVRAVRDARAARPPRGRARSCCARRSPARRGCAPVRGHRRAARDRDRLDGLRRRQRGPAVQRRAARPAGRSSPRSGATLGVGLELAFVVGLLVAIALVGALWWLGTEGMPRAGAGGRDRRELSRALRAHADPDRRRLRRRALLLAARLQRPGPVAARVGPARRRLGPARRRGRARSTTRS